MLNTTNSTILAIDDTPANLSLLLHILKDRYHVLLANSGARGLELAASKKPELILLDIMMPGMDGFEVCRRLKADPVTRNIPVIFLTARTEAEDEAKGFDVGAVDFIHKPITPPIVLARIHSHLQIRAWNAFLEDRQAWLQEEVERRVTQIMKLQDATIQIVISLAEFRDESTGNHIRRTSEYVRCLARELSARGEVPFDPATVDTIAKAAPLHDIGKMAIPDNILLKPGKLTPDEFELMKTHTLRGRDILLRIRKQIEDDNPLLLFATDIAYYHHERWDGNGYPCRLRGEDIPLSARLMAVSDVYDALRSRRPYKEPYGHSQAMGYITESKGSHFDPAVVDAFLARQNEFDLICQQLADEE